MFGAEKADGRVGAEGVVRVPGDVFGCVAGHHYLQAGVAAWLMGC